MKADKIFEKLGFEKTYEKNGVIDYERKNERFGFMQVIEFCRKSSGNHLVFSYQKGVNKDGFNNNVGLTLAEIKAINKKIKELKWHKRGNRK